MNANIDIDYNAVIYKLTSPNGKIYIGQSINIKQRLRKYKCNSFSGQVKLWNNCKKYNWNPIDSYEIIDTCNLENLDFAEIHWIAHYDSFINGLNSNEGGKTRKGFKHTEETKESLKITATGKKHTSESKLKISEAGRNMSECAREKIRKSSIGRKHSDDTKNRIRQSKLDNPYRMTTEQRMKVSIANMGNKKRLGKEHTQDTKNKISQAKKGIPNVLGMKKVICIDTKIIYDSQKDAGNKLKLSPSLISRVCNGTRNKCKGLSFMFYDEFKKLA
jgi:group I intron endonuclease